MLTCCLKGELNREDTLKNRLTWGCWERASNERERERDWGLRVRPNPLHQTLTDCQT